MNLKYLNLAFEYAEKAFVHGEVPIGAVIVKNNEIIGVGYNVKEEKQSVLAHAELIAINQASKKININIKSIKKVMNSNIWNL